jgi:hypothetical protein
MPLADRRPQGNRQEVLGHRSAISLPVSTARAIHGDGEDKIGRAVRGEAAAYRRIRFGDDGQAGWHHFWPRNEVQNKVHDPPERHRELLGKYTDADMHNIFAYLETFK